MAIEDLEPLDEQFPDVNGVLPQTPTGLPSLVKSASDFLTTPSRGFRGLGVGAERMLDGVGVSSLLPGAALTPQDVAQISGNIPNALNRASAATEPGYVPESGEQLGAMAGQTIGDMPLMYATGGFVSPQARLTYKMFGGLTSGGLTSAITQMSERGHIEPNAVKISAALGAALPYVKPLANFTKNIITGIRDVMGGSVGLRPGTVEMAGELGAKLRDVDGTTQTILKKIDDIQTGIGKIHEEAGEQLSKTRKRLGLPSSLAEKGERRFGRRLLDESVDIDPKTVAGNPGFREVKYNGTPLILPTSTVKKLEAEITEKHGENLLAKTPTQMWREAERVMTDFTTGKFKNVDSRIKLKTLDNLREKIGDYTDYAKSGLSLAPITKQESAIFNDLLRRVNDVVENDIGEAGKILRESEHLYHNAREFYDSFQANFATEERTARTVLGLLRDEVPEEVLGSGQTAINGIKLLEKKTGQKHLEPLMKAAASKNIKNVRAKSAGSIPAFGFGPEGIASAMKSLTVASDATSGFGSFMFNPITRMAITSMWNNRRGGK